MSRRRNLLIRGAMQRNKKALTEELIAAFERERRSGAKDTPSRQTRTRRNSWWAR